jgi:hypothetical protein
MNPLGVKNNEGYNAAVVYPFITNVNPENIHVYSSVRNTDNIPFEKIAELINNDYKVTVNNGGYCSMNQGLIPYVHHERLAFIIENETHGLSAFVGVYRSLISSSSSSSTSLSNDINGVCILTPRIKIERDLTTTTGVTPLSISIYVCEHMAWSRYDVSDRQSLELLETTEYIQKSREIAGEQTLYRYNEIPWFVIPFTTVYTYALSLERLMRSDAGAGAGAWHNDKDRRTRTSRGHTAIIKVSSINFALFYAFINECSRDFRCSILNEITHLQHLIQSGIYQVYMLILNKTRVLSVYIYGPSWARVSPQSLEDASKTCTHRGNNDSIHKKKTRGNRIERLHNYISQTSTAVVKYLPPVNPPKYNLSGKRVISANRNGTAVVTTADTLYNPSTEIPRLISSIRNKHVCDIQVFVYGFIDSLKIRCREIGMGVGVPILIDTTAHNYIIIDEIVRLMNDDSPVLWSHKWYYVLYNAIIHRELPCKDLFML